MRTKVTRARKWTQRHELTPNRLCWLHYRCGGGVWSLMENPAGDPARPWRRGIQSLPRQVSSNLYYHASSISCPNEQRVHSFSLRGDIFSHWDAPLLEYIL